MPEMDHVEVYADGGSVWVRQVAGGTNVIHLHACQVSTVVEWLLAVAAEAEAQAEQAAQGK